MGSRAAGTIEDNRTKKCPLPSQVEMKKRKRGDLEFQYDRERLLWFADGMTII